MQHGSPHPGVAGSELTRLLARLADAPPSAVRPAFAERLGHWLGWTDAIAVSTVLQAPLAGPVTGGPTAAVTAAAADFERVRAALAATIAAGPPAPDAGASPTDFAPYRRHCHAVQQALQDAIGPLRRRLREALARQSAAGARLAALDAAMDQALAAQERALLGLVTSRLQAHFERLCRADAAPTRSGGLAAPSLAEADPQAPSVHAPGPSRPGPAPSATAPAPPAGPPDGFLDDLTRVLLAELAHRLLPSRGLLDALRTPPSP